MSRLTSEKFLKMLPHLMCILLPFFFWLLYEYTIEPLMDVILLLPSIFVVYICSKSLRLWSMFLLALPPLFAIFFLMIPAQAVSTNEVTVSVFYLLFVVTLLGTLIASVTILFYEYVNLKALMFFALLCLFHPVTEIASRSAVAVEIGLPIK